MIWWQRLASQKQRDRSSSRIRPPAPVAAAAAGSKGNAPPRATLHAPSDGACRRMTPLTQLAVA
jgi:hypothetical protein